ncbi:MAG: phosphoribosylglycinamide formyltransferase [Bacillota bacterium]|jgi:phosphoribosylglycinamide formyltransferase-1
MVPFKLAVLVSGRGSNLQSIMDSIKEGRLKAQISIVVSNKADAYALKRAQNYGIPARYLNEQDYPHRREYDESLANLVQEYNPDLVVLAGYMRILTPEFLLRFPNKVINIHPALLPSFPGLNAQKQALAYGVKVTGCTVHYVDSGVDTGPIIAQKAVPVMDNDSVDSLSARILEQEHLLYPEVIKWISEGRVRIEGRKVIVY